MLGNTGDDLANMWGLIGVGGLFLSVGLTLVHRIWRKAAFGFAALFILSGLAWSLIRKASPALDGVMTALTSNPSNWFLLVFVLVIALWLHQWRKETWEGPEWAKVGSKRDSELTALREDLNALSGRIPNRQSAIEPGMPSSDPTLERDLKGLLAIAVSIAEIEFFKELLRQAPQSIDVEWSDEAENAVLEFISGIEARLIGSDYKTVYANIMKNAETQADKSLLLKQDGYACPVNREPYQFRKWAIARLQAEWFKDWFVQKIYEQETFIRGQREYLVAWHVQRVKKNAPH